MLKRVVRTCKNVIIIGYKWVFVSKMNESNKIQDTNLIHYSRFLIKIYDQLLGNIFFSNEYHNI